MIWHAVGVPSASRLAHAGLAFAHPMSDAAVDAMVAALPLPSGPLVLDSGGTDTLGFALLVLRA